jgi:hypothetical protein
MSTWIMAQADKEEVCRGRIPWLMVHSLPTRVCQAAQDPIGRQGV